MNTNKFNRAARNLTSLVLLFVRCLSRFIPNRSLESLPALVRLPASALSLHLDVARYAFDETSAHLLNNRTKSVKESNDRFGINHAHTTEKKQPLEKTLSTNLTYRKEKSY